MKLTFKTYSLGFCIFWFLVLSGNLICGATEEALFGDTTEDKSSGRMAAVYFSDGKVLTGKISLTPGRSFKLNIPEGGTLKTRDMVTGEDVQYSYNEKRLV